MNKRIFRNARGLALFMGSLVAHGASARTTNSWILTNLTVRAGDFLIEVQSGHGTNNELHVATLPFSTVDRQKGGTVEFTEDNSLGGVAQIWMGGSNFAVGRIGSWATYDTNLHGGAYTWAARDSLSNVVEFAEAGYSVNTFGAGNHVHLDGAPSIPIADQTAASLRCTNATALNMGGFTLDVAEGGILVTPTVAGAASINNGQLTSSGGELIVHNYAGVGGSLAISAGITGNVDLTFSGTGPTVLSGNNTFDGATRINGGTVQIDSASRLGNTVSNLELRGGTLFTTANMVLTNRTIVLGVGRMLTNGTIMSDGADSTFQVAEGTTNFIANVLSESNVVARLGDMATLVKTGGGTLDLGTPDLSRTNMTGYSLLQGLTDVREGTLRIVSANNFALGFNRSFYDGTVVRTGATLALGSNSFGFASNYALWEWLRFEQGSTFRVERLSGAYQSPSVNGVIEFQGDTTADIEAGDFYFNYPSAGYIMGPGDIIKDGDGTLNIAEYSPDYYGNIIVKDGNTRLLDGFYGGRPPTPNAGSFTIGLNDTTNRGTVMLTAWMERDGVGSVWDVDQNITVQGYSADTRLEIYGGHHNDVANFNGNINLSNFGSNGWTGSEFRFSMEDQLDIPQANGAAAYEHEFMNLNGDITGGDKRVRTVVMQTGGYNQSMEPVPGVQLTNEMNIMAFFTFSGSNSGWAGSLETGNRAGESVTWEGPDQDKQHFVRFGRNDGIATMAIGASNAVVLRHDATLQAYGSQVTIGNLISDGDSGGIDGYYGQQMVSNSFLENGGTVAGSFTINQSSNRIFNAVIRDGTYYSPSTNLASASLSIVKTGSGVLTFDRSNYYTGTTTVRGGLLQIAGSHIGGGLYSIENGGGLVISNGIVVADQLLATNGASAVVAFDSGALTVRSSTISNGRQFRVGNGTQSATMSLLGGTSTFADGLVVTNLSVLNGNGQIVGNVAVKGQFCASGLCSISGTYTQSVNGEFRVPINGYQSAGRLNATGPAALAGGLSLVTNGYAPRAGETFVILSAGSLAGTFGAAQLPPPWPRLGWDLRYGNPAGSVTLTVTGQVALATYDTWADYHRVGGNDLDHPSGSSVPYLMRYAMGLAPAGSVTVSTCVAPATSRLQIQFSRNTDATDVDCFVDATSNLADSGSWSCILSNLHGSGWLGPASVVESYVTDGLARVIVTDIPTTTPSRFLRIRICRP
ncbi:MAG TPA: autotransporter-associated beta strand repeat-containing protein [Verrucomicrobiae bacterium]|nr:autotransporter-associated beta strand repeat-containing protein [Verrucomicrobiae bacterium]